jgi:two-component system, OmpR family, alkaline phosphatase synthesis response regulator PhoP
MNKLLIIDDDDEIREFLSYNLAKEGFEIFTASNGNEGIELCLKHKPDLILLDVMMPGKDGIEVCSEIRSIPEIANTIICFLTARAEDYSIVAGLESGADDYLTKPIKSKILILKIKSLLRRSEEKSVSTSPQGESGIVIDRNRYMVFKDSLEIPMPRKEFELLALLASEPNKVFQREQILNSVWGTDVIVGDRTIDVHIRKIREKLGSDKVQTVKGVGYKFTE